MSPLRIVFMGSDPIALPLLNWLVSEPSPPIHLAAVYTQPDRAVGRGQKIVPNAIKTWALERGLLVYQPEKLDDAANAQLAGLAPDLSLVMAYGHILRDEFINLPRLGTLNLHASWLPRYRGASPIQTAIANGERETGVSLMRIVRRLDAGPVADLERVPIATTDTALDVEAKLSSACVPLVARNLSRLIDGTLVFAPQDDARATYCRRLVKEDGVLDFSRTAEVLAARVNGLYPWPACTLEVAGQVIKIGLAGVVIASDPALSSPMAPGAVLGESADGLLIQTGAGVLGLKKLQRAGGRMLDAAEFLRGFPLSRGTLISSQPMSELVGAVPFKK